MDSSQFLARRRADPRFTNELAVAPVGPTMSYWFSQGTRETSQPGMKRTVHQAAVKKDKDGKKHLTEGETSDGSDGGVCWSDYERTPGTEEGAKGSCRPKKSKKKKESSD